MAKISKKNIFYKLFILICILTVLSLYISGFLGQALGFHDYSTYDRGGGGPHVVKVPDAGDAIKIPTEFGQSTDDFEAYHQSWGGEQRKIYDKWVSDGETHSDRHWAYLNVNGNPRYLVALAPIFGITGDYVDIYITHNGEEKIYPCLIADEKDIWYDPAFTYNGKAYGHVGSNNTCKIIEVCTELAGVESNYSLMTPLLNDMKDITQIVNGGSWFEHPDGPIGLEGPYNYDDGTTSGGNSADLDDESETFLGALNMFFRNVWDSIATTFENDHNERNDSTVLYDIKNTTGTQSSAATQGNTSVGSNPKGTEVAEYAKSWVGKISYYLGASEPLKNGGQSDCSWFIFHCLNDCGLIDKWYKSTTWGSGGVPGTTKINSIKQAQPGDILFWEEGAGAGHVVMYVGDEKAVGCNGSSPTTGAVQLTGYKIPGGGREPDSIWRVNAQ